MLCCNVQYYVQYMYCVQCARPRKYRETQLASASASPSRPLRRGFLLPSRSSSSSSPSSSRASTDVASVTTSASSSSSSAAAQKVRRTCVSSAQIRGPGSRLDALAFSRKRTSLLRLDRQSLFSENARARLEAPKQVRLTFVIAFASDLLDSSALREGNTLRTARFDKTRAE